MWIGEEGTSARRLYVKGASEMVLRLCTHARRATDGSVVELTGKFAFSSEGLVSGDGAKADIAREVITKLADQALRTIALAYGEFPPPPEGAAGGGDADYDFD